MCCESVRESRQLVQSPVHLKLTTQPDELTITEGHSNNRFEEVLTVTVGKVRIMLWGKGPFRG